MSRLKLTLVIALAVVTAGLFIFNSSLPVVAKDESKSTEVELFRGPEFLLAGGESANTTMVVTNPADGSTETYTFRAKNTHYGSVNKSPSNDLAVPSIDKPEPTEVELVSSEFVLRAGESASTTFVVNNPVDGRVETYTFRAKNTHQVADTEGASPNTSDSCGAAIGQEQNGIQMWEYFEDVEYNYDGSTVSSVTHNPSWDHVQAWPLRSVFFSLAGSVSYSLKVNSTGYFEHNAFLREAIREAGFLCRSLWHLPRAWKHR